MVIMLFGRCSILLIKSPRKLSVIFSEHHENGEDEEQKSENKTREHESNYESDGTELVMSRDRGRRNGFGPSFTTPGPF